MIFCHLVDSLMIVNSKNSFGSCEPDENLWSLMCNKEKKCVKKLATLIHDTGVKVKDSVMPEVMEVTKIIKRK